MGSQSRLAHSCGKGAGEEAMKPFWRGIIWFMVAWLSALCLGCGGAGISFSKRPVNAAQFSVLGVPVASYGPRHPNVACYGYQSGNALWGASSRHAWTRAVG